MCVIQFKCRTGLLDSIVNTLFRGGMDAERFWVVKGIAPEWAALRLKLTFGAGSSILRLGVAFFYPGIVHSGESIRAASEDAKEQGQRTRVAPN